MKINLQSKNIDLSPEIKAYVEEKIGGLKKYSDNILGADVEVKKTTDHHHKGDIFSATVNLRLPGEIIRYEESANNIFPAVNAMTKGLKIQIKKYKEKNNNK